MKKNLRGKLGVAIATLGLLSTFAVTTAGATATLNGDLTFASTDGAAALNPAMGGSSFDEPYFNSAIPVYMSEAAKVSGANAPSAISLYSPTGSTAGKKGVVAGTYAVGASDVPMGTVVNNVNLDASILTNTNAASTLNSYVQVPVVLGGVGMMYNLPSLKAKFGKDPVILNSAILAGIYDGSITKWNDPAICHLNPKIATIKKNKKGHIVRRTCALPNLATVPVYRADGSGTTFIFMNYLNATQGANFKTSTGTEVYPNTTFNEGEVPSNGLGGQKNAGVAADVEQTVGAVGYVEYSYILLQHTLPAALIVNAKGKDVAINPTTIAADAADFSSTPPSESATGVVSNFSIVNGNGAGDYPIAGYSWAIVRQDWNGLGTVGGTTASLNSEKLVAKFLDWCVQSGSQGGQTVAQQQGYVPLPSYVSALAESQIASMKYNGVALGLS
ncbi:MAG: substrate-binding domain-containing protein [Acidimicrobiales bacterium]|jgi:phosphate transport system substrate-binding protein